MTAAMALEVFHCRLECYNSVFAELDSLAKIREPFPTLDTARRLLAIIVHSSSVP